MMFFPNTRFRVAGCAQTTVSSFPVRAVRVCALAHVAMAWNKYLARRGFQRINASPPTRRTFNKALSKYIVDIAEPPA
jgi:hypothetical protein